MDFGGLFADTNAIEFLSYYIIWTIYWLMEQLII